MDIKDQVCVVTGAASGLGRATVERLEAGGARVACLDLNAEALEGPARSPHRLIRAVDVTSGPALEAIFSEIKELMGTPRVLVNCAGILGSARVAKQGKDGTIRPRDFNLFSRVIEVNLVGTFNAVRLFASLASSAEPFITGERGVVVNTSSIAAEEALSGQSAYAASKGAISAMTLPLARELAKFGIRVIDIKPGVFRTAIYGDIRAETQESLVSDIPFPARLGDPAEFAQLVECIVTNPMLNGSGIRIDGASRMREPPAPANPSS